MHRLYIGHYQNQSLSLDVGALNLNLRHCGWNMVLSSPANDIHPLTGELAARRATR